MKYNMRPAFARYGLRLFDVTMRDGLQSVKTFIPLEKKKDMAIDIITKYNPSSIEIGSLVSEKAIPQMSTSIELFKFTSDYVIESGYLNPKIFMLIPPKFDRFAQAHELGVKHISIMSSVSDDFQKKNVRMSIAKTRSVINNSLRLLPFKSAKVYLSCVDECPVSKKKLNINTIIHNINDYVGMSDVTEVCLSDTMGTLKWWRFVSIIEGMNDRNIPLDKISIHLHLPSNTNYDNIMRIVHAAIKSGIYNIDISAVSTGGCNMTLDNTQLHGNMTYDVLESIIEKSERMTQRKYNNLMLEN